MHTWLGRSNTSLTQTGNVDVIREVVPSRVVLRFFESFLVSFHFVFLVSFLVSVLMMLLKRIEAYLLWYFEGFAGLLQRHIAKPLRCRTLTAAATSIATTNATAATPLTAPLIIT